MSSQKVNAAPFLKWAGGKRQLLGYIHDLMPNEYGKYVEPFVGGGAVLFDLQPGKAIINDINEALITTYTAIQQEPEIVINLVHAYDAQLVEGGKDYYYEARDYYNDKLKQGEQDIELASLLIFLNKHCFNGLYRVNRQGLFNVPFNNNVKNSSLDEDNIRGISAYLQQVTIMKGDFVQASELAEPGDFVFFDSPYAPLKDDTFEAYTKEGFDRESHIRLAETFKRLSARGCFCMLTNHNTPFINELYKNFKRQVVSVKRMINRDANNRTGEEVIVTSY